MHVSELPPPEPDSYYAFQLVGLAVVDEERPGARRASSRCTRASRTTTSSSTDGTLVPLIDDAVRTVDLEAGRIVVERGFLGA